MLSYGRDVTKETGEFLTGCIVYCLLGSSTWHTLSNECFDTILEDLRATHSLDLTGHQLDTKTIKCSLCNTSTDGNSSVLLSLHLIPHLTCVDRSWCSKGDSEATWEEGRAHSHSHVWQGQGYVVSDVVNSTTEPINILPVCEGSTILITKGTTDPLSTSLTKLSEGVNVQCLSKEVSCTIRTFRYA